MNDFLFKWERRLRIVLASVDIYRERGRKEAVAFLKRKFWS